MVDATTHNRPDAATLAAFAGTVVIAAGNVVAVRLSNQELPPFWGAAVRFSVASGLLFALTALMRIRMPRGRALAGALVYGVLAFLGAYAFVYYALVELPAGLGATVMGTGPLLTLFFAVLHGAEGFRWRGLAGAALAAVGIGVIFAKPPGGAIPVLSLIAMFAGAVCAAESGVVIKLFPRTHLISLNAVAMGVGSLLMFALSAVRREHWFLPSGGRTWMALGYLIVLGSVGLFTLVVFVIQRWTASGASYQFVLFPPVSILFGVLLLGERVNLALAAGTALILTGVYVGALSSSREVSEPEPAKAPT